jgi:hypothetical protein
MGFRVGMVNIDMLRRIAGEILKEIFRIFFVA